MTHTNCTSNGSVWCLANHPNLIYMWIKFWLERGQTNVLSDARLFLCILTPSRTIFCTINRKYFARKNTPSLGFQDVSRQPQKQYQEFSYMQQWTYSTFQRMIIAPNHSCITPSCKCLQLYIILENLLPLVWDKIWQTKLLIRYWSKRVGLKLPFYFILTI